MSVVRGPDYKLPLSHSKPTQSAASRKSIETEKDTSSWFEGSDDSSPRGSWFGYGKGTHDKKKVVEKKEEKHPRPATTELKMRKTSALSED